jgi:hypothetical protein
MPPKLNPDLYGKDETGTAEALSSRALGVPAPTLDINGEKDERAVSEGNMGTKGGGKSDQGEKASGADAADQSMDGGT